MTQATDLIMNWLNIIKKLDCNTNKSQHLKLSLYRNTEPQLVKLSSFHSDSKPNWKFHIDNIAKIVYVCIYILEGKATCYSGLSKDCVFGLFQFHVANDIYGDIHLRLMFETFCFLGGLPGFICIPNICTVIYLFVMNQWTVCLCTSRWCVEYLGYISVRAPAGGGVQSQQHLHGLALTATLLAPLLAGRVARPRHTLRQRLTEPHEVEVDVVAVRAALARRVPAPPPATRAPPVLPGLVSSQA